MDTARTAEPVGRVTPALLGGVVSLMLEWVALFVWYQSWAGCNDWGSCTEASCPGTEAFQEIRNLHLMAAKTAVGVLVGQCLIAFWVGRRTAPQWYWGLGAALGKVVGAGLLAILLWGPHNGCARDMLPASVVIGTETVGLYWRVAISTALIALAAYLGTLSLTYRGNPHIMRQ